MLDFTSCLYLGLRHESDALPAWSSLSTGKPAALEDPPGARRVARKLAELQGCETALMAPSTLHLFWDLFGHLRGLRRCLLRGQRRIPDCKMGRRARRRPSGKGSHVPPP